MKKLLLIALLGILLVGIPVSLYLIQTQQDTRQRAGNISPSNTATDSCTKVTLSVTQTSPDPLASIADEGRCPDLATAPGDGRIVPRGNPNGSGPLTHPFDKISYNILIESVDGAPHEVEISTSTFFCTTPYGELSSDKKFLVCNQNGQNYPENGVQSIKKTVSGNQPYSFTVERGSNNGTSCGSYQFDIAVYSVDGNTGCTIPNVAQVCQTGIDAATCVPPTGTPTPTQTTIPTQTPSPTPTVAPTITPVPTIPACPVPEAVKNVRINCPNCSI